MDALQAEPLAFNWDDWIGLPFEDLGEGSHDFFCWYLVRAVLRQAKGIHLPTFEERKGTPLEAATMDLAETESSLTHWHEVPVAEAEPFDVMVFRSSSTRAHVGVVVSKGKFLHGGRGLDSGIDRYTSINWRSRIEGVYRYQP